MNEIKEPGVPRSETPSIVADLEGDDKIMAESKERFNVAEEQMIDIQREALDDLTFIAGEQWPEAIKRQRSEPGGERPCLRVNRLPAFLNQVINDGRQNKIQIKVHPTKDATEVVADVKNGLIRNIQYNSDSNRAIYDAFASAVQCGLGWFRITTEYEPRSFHENIRIRRIDNPLTVFVPINYCQEPDFSDMPWCFISETISKEEFKAQYPDVDMADWESSAQADVETRWLTDQTVRLAEYFVKEKIETTIYMLSDGSIVTDVNNLPEGLSVVKERVDETCKIKWYKLCGACILERGEFPGRHIPVIAVTGPTMNLAGRKVILSLTRFAKDPARMVNYFRSAETEAIALAPLAPWLVAEGQIKGYEKQWAVSNKKNLAVLPYKPQANSGQAVPPPQRIQASAIDIAVVNAAKEAIDDLKAVTGIYDASLGAKGNETSGRAITARQREGDTANYHYFENLSNAVRRAGKIILEIIPIIYDTPRQIRILGADETEKVVMVNQAFQNEAGEEAYFDMATGEYDVTVDIGPSYQTRRIEAADTLVKLVQANPQLANVTGDLLAKFVDAPAEIVDRLKKLVPAQLQDDQGSQGSGSPKDKALIQQMDTVIQKMQAEIAKLTFINKDKAADRQVEMDKTVIQSNAKIQEAKMKQAHQFAMRASDNPAQLMGLITEIAARLDNLEAQLSPAPAQTAEVSQ
jgi:hypothetical protein